MERWFAVIGAVLGLTGVALGAFGAHLLEGRIDERSQEVYEIGVRYQMYHALALFAVAWVISRWPDGGAVGAGWAMVVGTVIFSGSLYALAGTGYRWFGAITPIGGIALLVGWALLAWSLLRG